MYYLTRVVSCPHPCVSALATKCFLFFSYLQCAFSLFLLLFFFFEIIFSVTLNRWNSEKLPYLKQHMRYTPILLHTQMEIPVCRVAPCFTNIWSEQRHNSTNKLTTIYDFNVLSSCLYYTVCNGWNPQSIHLCVLILIVLVL